MTGNLPIDPIGPLSSTNAEKALSKSKAQGADRPSFAEVLKESIQEVNQLKQEADAAIQDLATGRSENVSEVLTAVEKADIAFRAMMSIRNKLVDAYEEINRLRV